MITKNHYPNLLTKEELNNIINITPLMTTERVKVLGLRNVTWEFGYWQTDPNTFPPHIMKYAIDNYVCYIKDATRFSEKINKVAGDLEKIHNTQVDAHIYINKNPELDHPFGIHHDISDNVIVQCEGVTNFKVWNITLEDEGQDTGRNSNLVMDKPPDIDQDLEPGDSIWIPAHTPHLATSKTPRFSVSFPMVLEHRLKESGNPGFHPERGWFMDFI